MDALDRIDDLTEIVLILSLLIVGLCAYIYNVRPPLALYCPMHRRARTECKPEWHDD